MYKRSILRVGVMTGLLLVLAGCGGSDEESPEQVQNLPDLASGAHVVVMSGDSAGNDGYALVAPDGKAFVLLSNDSNKPINVVYKRAEGATTWQRVPSSGSHSLTMRLDISITGTVPQLPMQLQQYHALVSGSVVAFSIAPNGTITTGSSACRLSGSIGAIHGPFRTARLEFSGCGDASGQYRGVVFVDPNAPNAAFRVVVHNAAEIQDFYVYPD